MSEQVGEANEASADHRTDLRRGNVEPIWEQIDRAFRNEEFADNLVSSLQQHGSLDWFARDLRVLDARTRGNHPLAAGSSGHTTQLVVADHFMKIGDWRQLTSSAAAVGLAELIADNIPLGVPVRLRL